jgi:hypothetical protein
VRYKQKGYTNSFFFKKADRCIFLFKTFQFIISLSSKFVIKRIVLANLISERELWLQFNKVISANSQSAIAYVGFEEEQATFVGVSTSKM